MKRMLFAVGVVALVAPFAALAADGSGGEGTNAARTCKAERAADAAAFRAKYGKNTRTSNALGKCVSQAAKTKTP